MNADISASAAIAYSKLALTGSLLPADIQTNVSNANMVLTYDGWGVPTAALISNNNISGSAAIAYSK